jgi:RNA polymerase sigma factor (sigma-70 family)
MTTVRLNAVIRHLRGRLVRDERAIATDAALLERFLVCRDEDAFAEVVRRHGAMVYGVCRRLLRNPHDADDAFQATFLVLVQKGSAVRLVRSVGCWLYGVARRTALEARRAAARRRVKEASAMAGPATVAAEGCDLREVLDTEIDRLPEKLRSPLVLCDLEGKTRKEAARHLGWPEGTVASRLAAARKMLGKRLTGRGVSLSGGVLALAMAAGTATAVPPELVSSTVQVAVGRALSSSGVASLVKGVLLTMLLKKLKASVVVILVAALLGVGGTVFRGAGGAEAFAADDAKPRSELETLRHENELLKLNIQVVLEKVHAQEAEMQALKRRAQQMQIQWQQTGQGTAPFFLGTVNGQLGIGGGLQPLHAGGGGSALGNQRGGALGIAGALGVIGGVGAPQAVGGGGALGIAGGGALGVIGGGGSADGSMQAPVTVQPSVRGTPPTGSSSSSTSGTSTTASSSSGSASTTFPGETGPALGLRVDDDPLQRAEAAMRRLREAKNGLARQRAVNELEAALAQLKVHHGKTGEPAKAP